MKLQLLIEPTDELTRLDGVPVRRWTGTGPNDGRFDVWVHRVGSDDPRALDYMEACLVPQPPPKSVDGRAGRDRLRGILLASMADAERKGPDRLGPVEWSLHLLLKELMKAGRLENAVAFVMLCGLDNLGLSKEVVNLLIRFHDQFVSPPPET